MGWFMNLFGQRGKVRFEGELVDGQAFTGKTEIECFGVDKEELENRLKQMMYVETGKQARTLRIVAFVEY